MYGYKIAFEGLPKPVWGCETAVTDYSWENRRTGNILEISMTASDYLVKYINKKRLVLENARFLSCTVPNVDISSYSTPGTQVLITTVAARFEKLTVEEKDFTVSDCADPRVLLLPAFTETMSDDEMDKINILLHKYIRHNERSSEYDKISCYSIFYEILARLDSYTRKQLNKDTKESYNHYVKKVNFLIQSRYHTKLTEETIAKELGISSGYLSTMYKESTGRTLSEYLLMIRMRKAEELMENTHMPTAKIAETVGFSDENYFRKKFKKYFGMSVKEYKNIKRGNTLYHEKPIRNSANQ